MAPPLTRVGSPALTREELVNILTMPLAQQNVILNSGVRIYDAPTATPLKLPKLTAYSNSGFYAEGDTIADTDAPTSYLTLLPPTLKSVKTWLPMSSEVIRNSPLALDAAMRDNLVFSVSRTLEKAFLTGDATPDANGNRTPAGILTWANRVNEVQTVTITGGPTGGTWTLTFNGQSTSPINYNAAASTVATALAALSTIGPNNVAVSGSAGGPYTVTFQRDLGSRDIALMTAISALTGGTTPAVGVAETTKGVDGTQSIDKAGGSPSLDDVAGMINLLENAFATPRRFFMTPNMLTHMRLLKDGYGRFMLEPNPTVERGMLLFGIPVSTTVHLTSATAGQSSVVLMDTELIAVARDLAPEARIFTETLAKQDEIALRVSARYDIGSIWPAGVCVMKNALET